MQKILLPLAVCTAIFSEQAVYAASPSGYVGISVGLTTFKDVASAASLDTEFAAGGYTSSSTIDDNAGGWKIFGGYKFNNNFAVEGSYRDMGSASARSTISAPVTGTVNTSLDTKTWELSAVGILPMARNFELFGKAGIHYWDAKFSSRSTVTGISSGSQSANGTGLMYGVGGGINITRNVVLRAELEFLANAGDKNKTGQTDLEMLSGGVQFKF